MDEAIASLFKEAEQRVANTKSALEKLGQELGYKIIAIKEETEIKKDASLGYEESVETKQSSISINNDIYQELFKVSEPLANSYKQVHYDLNDLNRISWSGTAHEIRQILSTLLHTLAPDEVVAAQPNFKLEQNAKGPSQKQRVVYILKKHKASSRIEEVVEKVVEFEEAIGNLVRGFYGRASDAAHRSKDKIETQRLLKYFDAFAHDLLDI